MDARAERLGRNEVVYREVNEGIRAADARFGGDRERLVTFFCECGDASCAAPLELTLAEYEHVRSSGRWFAVLPGHDEPTVECVVETFPDRRAVMVEKRSGAAEIAEAHDPRA